jgi:hypothetical protein
MIPLKLTAKEQEILAEICQLCSYIKYDIDVGELPTFEITEKTDTLLEIIEKSEFNSQKWGSLYDRLHRTGENS